MIVVAAALALGCEPAPVAELDAVLAEAGAAFADADLDRFAAARDRADALVPCLSEALPPRTAAELHRMQGLGAFFAGDAERGPLAFAAARRVEPDFRFPEALVPAGNPLLDAYHRRDPYGIPDAEAPAPAEGSLHFDGASSTRRPGGVPTVFQRLDGAGRVAASAYLWPDVPLPDYPTALVEEAPPTSARARSAKLPLAIGAAGAALLTGSLYGAAAAVHGTYQNPDTATDRLDGLRATNNALVVSSSVGLVATLGLGTAALVVK